MSVQFSSVQLCHSVRALSINQSQSIRHSTDIIGSCRRILTFKTLPRTVTFGVKMSTFILHVDFRTWVCFQDSLATHGVKERILTNHFAAYLMREGAQVKNVEC